MTERDRATDTPRNYCEGVPFWLEGLVKPFEKMARPERLELLIFWFVAEHGQDLNACFGVTYESENAS